MIRKCYAVYDNKAQLYNFPFPASSEVEAVRAFTTAVMTPDTNLARFPADYELHYVGDFDDTTGAAIPRQLHEQRIIINAAALQYREILRRKPKVDQDDLSHLQSPQSDDEPDVSTPPV